MAPQYKCGICRKNVNKMDAGVECGICSTWFHIGCVAIPTEFYDILGSNKNISFNCTRCLNDQLPANSDGKFSAFFTALEKKFTEGIDLLDRKISTSLSTFAAEMRTEQQNLRKLIESTAADIRADCSKSIDLVKADVVACNENMKKIEIKTLAKIDSIDLERNKLHRKLNRADIVFSGLPSSIDDLTSMVLKICAHLKIAVDGKDINHCLYMQRNKSILCKFNNIHLRDEIMRAYFKSPVLRLCDAIETNISSRVYLNDNLTPAGLRFYNLCRALKKDGKIIWFRLLNKDVPICKVKFPDGSEKMMDYGELSGYC